MAAAKGNTNWFVVGVSIAVVAVLVILGGLVIFLNNRATAPGVTPQSGGIINPETGAVSFGSGETQVDTYVDFLCPACSAFEQQYGGRLMTAANEGRITLNIHPVSILDRMSQNTRYSTRSAAAAYCVAENAPDSFMDFFKLLFERQPQENVSGYTDDQLTSMANEVGAGAAASCIADGTYQTYVGDQTRAREVRGTPTVDINGERLNLQGGDITRLEQAIAG